METSVRPEYEFTALRIVLLVIAIVLWFLLGFGAAVRGADADAGSFVG